MFQIQTEHIKENIIKQGIVSHLKLPSYAGGILYLTDKRVFFKSNDKDFPDYNLNLPFGESFKVKKYSLLGLLKNAFTIGNNRKLNAFFTDERDDWINAIRTAQTNFKTKNDE